MHVSRTASRFGCATDPIRCARSRKRIADSAPAGSPPRDPSHDEDSEPMEAASITDNASAPPPARQLGDIVNTYYIATRS